MKKFAVLALALMLAVVVVPAVADEAIDDFDYPVGPLTGQNGGTGWADAWNASAIVTVSTPGLIFPGVITNGNAASVGPIASGAATATRHLAFGYKYGGLSTTSYFSFLVRPDTNFGQWGSMMLRQTTNGTEFGLTTNPSNQVQSLFIQQGGPGGLLATQNFTYTAGTTYLVKGQLDVDALGAGVLQAWVYDNDPNSNPALAYTSLNLTYVGQDYWGGSYDPVTLYSSGNYTYDLFEIKGPPVVPEAGTMVALGSFLSMGGLFLRRRFVKS